MTAKILVAGIGNVFLGDDGFGVEVAARLAGRPMPEGVEVADYGVRGYDLAFALMDGYDVAILVDAIPQGKTPGTLFVLEPDLSDLDGGEITNGHGMNPVEVFRLVTQLGGTLPRTYLVGCEPAEIDPDGEGSMQLSPTVEAAVDDAVDLVGTLVDELVARPAGVDE
jgi:hydrogenase maturation protease